MLLHDIPLKDFEQLHGPDELGLYTYYFYAFNTLVSIKVKRINKLNRFFENIKDTCRKFERLFSAHLENSDVVRINTNAGKKVQVHPLTAELVRAAIKYCEKSDGVFDITIGSVTKLYDLATKHIPTQEELKQALEYVDFRQIEVSAPNEQDTWVKLEQTGASIDLGGIAKGFIADKLAQMCKLQGVYDVVINLGGNVVALGRKPDGSFWSVGIQDPFDKNKLCCAVNVRDESVVTTGAYERSFVKNSIRYHHILSPQTGKPIELELASVTIKSHKSLDGDGFSTTLFAFGKDKALAFVEKQENIEALLVTKNNEIVTSKGFVF